MKDLEKDKKAAAPKKETAPKKAAVAASSTIDQFYCTNKGNTCTYTGSTFDMCGIGKCAIRYCMRCSGISMAFHKQCIHNVDPGAMEV